MPDPGTGEGPPSAGAGASLSPANSGVAAAAGFVDGHVHVFPDEMIREREAYLGRDPRFGALYRSPNARMVSADEVVAQMDVDGVDLSVLVGFPFDDLGLCRMVNDCVLEAVRKYPGRLAGLACVPRGPGAKAELERCLDAGLCGCGELAPEGRGFGDAGSGGRGLAVLTQCLSERRRPLLVHASEPVGHQYPGKGVFTPEACFALARACPEMTIVLAHMGGGLFLYEMMPEVRQTLARVFYDTAAVPYLYGPEIYGAAVSIAGPEKFIFGSDFPLLPAGRYRDGLDTLSDSARAAVGGSNARRVYGL